MRLRSAAMSPRTRAECNVVWALVLPCALAFAGCGGRVESAGGDGTEAASTGLATPAGPDPGDTDDHFSVPAGTLVAASLKSGTTMDLGVTLDGVPVTVTCATLSASGAVPSSGLSITLAKPPTLGACHDSLGGVDTVVTNATNGKWKLTEIDAVNDEAQREPNTGDKLAIVIPKGGMTVTSSVISGCTLTLAPSGPASLAGTYNDSNTSVLTNVAAPASGSGCTAGATVTVSGTLVLSKTLSDRS
jgi:hypothetical protein